MKRIRSPFLVLLALLLPAWSMAQFSVGISVNVAPPELPVYDQPPIPGDGYVWTPGYWGWSDDDQDYYWVPGTWVLAPQPEFLWTPGYWGMESGLYLFHEGYWGPHVGFYGGVNYGYGYGGNGYEGGYWQGGHLFYNRSVTNIGDVHITNVYNKTVVNNVTVNRVSYNGGNGIQARPTPEQVSAAQEHHVEATPEQRQHVSLARTNPSLRASRNNGHPPIAATSRPGSFSGAGVVAAKQSGPVHQNTAAAAPRSPPAQHNAPVPRNAPAPQQNTAEQHSAEPRNIPPHAEPPHTEAPRAPAPRPAPPHVERPPEHAPEHQDHEH